ncbi:MAG TPA: helix-hairpin-helix domain-containing protein [Pseudogracilibacillus sp.]|nr:helix-hairpin-helix domain-containing protein [Pseudogracilibacillus sp.]
MVIDLVRRHAVFVVIIIGVFVFFIMFMKTKDDTVQETDDIFPMLENELEAEASEATETEGLSQANEDILVDIKGAVKSPAVYKMEQDARVQDVVDKAGGFTKHADETMINLAQKLTDEMVIYVPIEGEEPLDGLPLIASDSTTNPQATEEGKVHLNSATQAEIETLNGIGPKKAESILIYREENGPFQSVEQLTEVSGIGDKTVENIRDQLVVP